jgi:hypothetical protein
MSRTLALGLVLFGVMGASVRPPDAPIGEPILQDLREAQARRREMQERQILLRELQRLEMAEREAAQAAALIVQGLFVPQACTDEQIERWVFQRYGNASGTRQRLESQLATHVLLDIDRTCKLTDAQMTKLHLAGRGDIKRFFDRYETVKRKLQSMNNDGRIFPDILQHISALQMTLQSGLFHEDSLLVKSLPNTLTGDQFVRYEAMARKRRATLHRESVLDAVAILKVGFERAVATLERNIVLREAQRQELITLMTRETKPSRRPGPYDSQVLLFELGRLPEEKLKRLFDEDQWQIVNQQLIGYRQLEPMLKRAGLIPTNDDGADNPDEQLSISHNSAVPRQRRGTKPALAASPELVSQSNRKGLSGSSSWRISSTGSLRPGPLKRRLGQLKTSPDSLLMFL